jgi:hypothetical protein
MRTPLVVFGLTFSLVACGGGAGSMPTAGSAPSAQTSLAGRGPDYEVCGERGFSRLDPSGGQQGVPHIAKEKQFMGDFGYAAIQGAGKFQGLVFSCPTSDPIAPTPQGYTADWFGSWTLYCKGNAGCGGVSFANGNLMGSITANVWVPSRTYYLYVYTLYSRQLIESYQIGPVTPGKHGDSGISFASPFENGFTYPQGEAYALEIVHPSSE